MIQCRQLERAEDGMPYDLLIKDGMVVDGTGFGRYRADVAVKNGKIADIGRGLNMLPLVGCNPLRLSVMDKAAWDRAATPDEISQMQALLRVALEEGAWGWSTTVSPTHAGPGGEPVPTRLAANDERVALGRTLGEFNRGIIEILPPGAGQPDDADRQHLLDVARASGRPVFFLGFDASARGFVEDATRGGAQLYNLLRAIPLDPRFTLKKTTFFANLDVRSEEHTSE